MKFIKLEIFALLFLICSTLLFQYKLSFGWYNYTIVKATLTDKDWLGGPYIVKENNFKDRCFETADIYRKSYDWEVDDILDDYPYLLVRMGNNTPVIFDDDFLLELCIDISEENISISEDGLFNKEIDIDIKFDVAWSPMVPLFFQSTDDYFIHFQSKLDLTSFTSESYTKEKIREFALLKCLDTVNEYGNLDKLLLQRKEYFANQE